MEPRGGKGVPALRIRGIVPVVRSLKPFIGKTVDIPGRRDFYPGVLPFTRELFSWLEVPVSVKTNVFPPWFFKTVCEAF
jgi:hypothetical protein